MHETLFTVHPEFAPLVALNCISTYLGWVSFPKDSNVNFEVSLRRKTEQEHYQTNKTGIYQPNNELKLPPNSHYISQNVWEGHPAVQTTVQNNFI